MSSGSRKPGPSGRGSVDPFIVMDVMRAANAREAALAAQGSNDRVIHMEVGQPGTPAPATARKAAADALEADRLGYTEALGLPALRERIARHYADDYGVKVDPGRIAITNGSSGGFQLAFIAGFEAGDRIALAMPTYPAYRNILKALDLEAVPVRTGPEHGFQMTAEALREAAGQGSLHGALIASPANPTGAMIAPDELERIAQAAEDLGIWLVSDEIYHGLTYGTVEQQTALAFSDDAIVVNSFSKYYSMTGWRIGWMVLPERLTRTVERLSQNLFICAPAISQHAALASFDATEELDANAAVYAANRDLLMAELPDAGFRRLAPSDGAFYVYADVSHLTDDSAAFCARLLEEAGIAVTPGIDFDPEEGHAFIRFSYAGTTADMREAVRRLKALDL